MSAHTPGPWILGNEDEQCCDVECGGGRTSISLNRFDSLMRDEFHISRAEMLANARLIAASPELLAVASALLHISDVHAVEDDGGILIADAERFDLVVDAARVVLKKLVAP